MKPTPKQLLRVYRRQLEVYVSEGRKKQAAIQRRLIARLEAKDRG